MRGDDDVGEGVEGVVEGEGLGGGDVEGGAAEVAALEGLDEGVLVDDLAPCGVDEDGAWLHGGEGGDIEEVASLGGERGVEGDEVGFGEEL